MMMFNKTQQRSWSRAIVFGVCKAMVASASCLEEYTVKELYSVAPKHPTEHEAANAPAGQASWNIRQHVKVWSGGEPFGSS